MSGLQNLYSLSLTYHALQRLCPVDLSLSLFFLNRVCNQAELRYCYQFTIVLTLDLEPGHWFRHYDHRTREPTF
ncbi:hypothetical protein VNO77_24471 [Canavalia gladiata]|uniref:Uncharacterized protein n=1 Tax=Canavalia gladiata TaxID=3824 RepID=A0AAN9L7N9_CANGL